MDTDPFLELVSHGLSLLRSGAFFAAHEKFEDGFRAARGDARRELRALAQLAAAYHQLELGRARASRSTFRKALAQLEGVPSCGPGYAARLDAFFAALGVSAEGPRFLDPKGLPPREAWPYPDDRLAPGS